MVAECDARPSRTSSTAWKPAGGAARPESLRGSLNALEQQDSELADEVIAFDDEVDARYLEISQGVEQLLAARRRRRRPTARSRRPAHQPRPGAHGRPRVTIAKLTKLTADLPPDETLVEAFEEMGARAEEMTRVAMRSFAERDVDGAESLVDLDELIDRANRRVVEHVLGSATTWRSANGACE